MTGLQIENCRVEWGKLGSVLAEGGRIARVSEDPSPAAPEGTVRVDARGATLLPGLADTHCHPFELGWLKRNVDLRGTGNLVGLRLRLFAAAQKAAPGDWVVGMGWDHEAFPDRKLPSRWDIDEVTAMNPVAVTRVCGHITLLNSRAIEALRLGGAEGARYDRDPDGRLTGIVRESAQDEVFSKIPGRSAEQCLSDLQGVEFDSAKVGLTSLSAILSADGYKEELEALLSLCSEGTSAMRYRVYIPLDAMGFVREKGIRERLGDEKARIIGVKLYADGSLGARTAALREPYSDEPGNQGMLRYTDGELADLVAKADAEGYQVVVHAIGDRAVEQAIEALSAVAGGGNHRRHRIEHASLLPKDLRSKMRKHGLRAAVQPCFISSDVWAVQRLGEERARDLYPFRSMLEDGIVCSGSSDAPIESLSPIIGMWAAMVRPGYLEEERLTLTQAVDLYTRNAAENSGEPGEDLLREGGRADFTLFDSDIEGFHPAMLRKTGIAATVVGGNLVYSFEGNV